MPRQGIEVEPQISGILDQLYVEPGDAVKQGDLIARIIWICNMVNLNNADNWVFEGRVDESEVAKILPGMDLIEGQTFAASLKHIAPRAPRKTNAIQFEICAALAQHDGILIRATTPTPTSSSPALTT